MDWLNSIPAWLKITLGILMLGLWLLNWLTPLFDSGIFKKKSKKD